MSTFSPDRALARPGLGALLWTEGGLAAALWLLGGLFTQAWPDAGRRWPFSEVGAGAVHSRRRTAVTDAELPLLAPAARVCSVPENGWRCCRCSSRYGKG